MSEKEGEGEKGFTTRALERIRGLKLGDDTSNEERFINRSLKIRALVRAWMVESFGNRFDSWEEMGAKTDNYCKKMGLNNGASSGACRRWIYQWSMDDVLGVYIESSQAGYAIRERPSS